MFETLTKGFRSARNRLAGVTELTEVRSEYLEGPRTPWTYGHMGAAIA
jgi:hypothetical protein